MYILLLFCRPLGPLQFVRIWHDNSGIREMQPWYLAYIIIYDIQTGEKYRHGLAVLPSSTLPSVQYIPPPSCPPLNSRKPVAIPLNNYTVKKQNHCHSSNIHSGG
jgi:hypothetical protein